MRSTLDEAPNVDHDFLERYYARYAISHLAGRWSSRWGQLDISSGQGQLQLELRPEYNHRNISFEVEGATAHSIRGRYEIPGLAEGSFSMEFEGAKYTGRVHGVFATGSPQRDPFNGSRLARSAGD